MRYAIFADIHGNLEALETALEYVKKQRLSSFMILGDSIGYGANPNECLSWALQSGGLHVMGNHEAAVIHDKIFEKFTSSAREAIDWTGKRLKPELIAKIKGLPYLQIEGSVTLAHGTLHSPEEFHYLFDESDAYKSFLALRTPFGFVGHSHVPSFFAEKAGAGGYLKEGVLKLRKNERYLLNPGSIGQPRDRDPRLSFGILDEDKLTFEIVRLPYDNKRASEKILAEGLPSSLAYRLL
jgi:diadenosine tetraphosphatase ApaH/serine/threonine PP2A family protein phosphatase